jgi:hypothetical protein
MLDIDPNILPHQGHHFALSSNRVPPEHVISFISLHEEDNPVFGSKAFLLYKTMPRRA